MTELRVRLQELEEEQGIVRATGKPRTDLQEWVIRLNKASKKKADLIQFSSKELLLPLTGNETVPALANTPASPTRRCTTSIPATAAGQ